MQGLDLSKSFFNEYGLPMLNENFSDVLPYLCTGLIGEGSECLRYDDDVSIDHDFEPGFCIFLPGEDIVDRKIEFQLERAYSKLPKEYMGYKRQSLSPVGGNRHGVIRISDFLKNKTGYEDGNLDLISFLHLPEQNALEITNGEIFFDNYGLITQIRDKFSYYPEDVKRKKLAGNLLLMAQSGQYNYLRTIKHGEYASAQLAIFEFANACISTIFLLNKVYRPYYKWCFRALRSLNKLSINAELLEYLITTDNSETTCTEKYDVIESISSDIISELIDQNLTKAICGDLEKHAYSVNDSISNNELRNMHILSGI